MKHFSHPHELQLQTMVPVPPPTLLPVCSCCQLLPNVNEEMLTCMACNYFLHVTCADYPQVITHPSHKNHALALIPTAAYPGGVFNCDACNRHGTGFNYHCSSCEYDLHVTCASEPLQISLPNFHPCLLHLCFTNPYANAKGFSCDVCHKIGFKEWLYRCAACDFDAHMNCAQHLVMTSGHSQRTAVSPRPRFVDNSSSGLVEDGSITLTHEMVQDMIGGYMSGGAGGDGLGDSPDQHKTRKLY